MSKSNMFVLDNKKGAYKGEPRFVPKEWSPDEIKAKLENYIQLPRDKWLKMDLDGLLHVVFYKKTGKFNGGGYLQYFAKQTAGDEEMILGNRRYPVSGQSGWIVKFNEIDTLYVRKNIINVMQDTIITDLTARVVKLEKKLQSMSRKHTDSISSTSSRSKQKT